MRGAEDSDAVEMLKGLELAIEDGLEPPHLSEVLAFIAMMCVDDEEEGEENTVGVKELKHFCIICSTFFTKTCKCNGTSFTRGN